MYMKYRDNTGRHSLKTKENRMNACLNEWKYCKFYRNAYTLKLKGFHQAKINREGIGIPVCICYHKQQTKILDLSPNECVIYRND